MPWGMPAPKGGSGPKGVPAPKVGWECLLLEGLVPAPGGGYPGLHPRGKLRGIRSRPTPKGEIEGDQIQAHTKAGN